MTDSNAHADEKLDEALEETFPASDAPANTVETGIAIGELPRAAGIDAVVDNKTSDRFELAAEGALAFLVYKRTHDALALIHTEVPVVCRGRGLGEALVEAALRSARSEGLRVIPICPFAKAYILRHHSGHRQAGA
jgi:predicted GNAT family acetyltransferase